MNQLLEELIAIVRKEHTGQAGHAAMVTEFFDRSHQLDPSELHLTLIAAVRAASQATPPDTTPLLRPTAHTILEAMTGIMKELTNGTMSAADAKARLYAHQIALSAMRTIQTAKARKQKEARLRSPKPQPPHHKSKPRKARKKKANRNPSSASSTKRRTRKNTKARPEFRSQKTTTKS